MRKKKILIVGHSLQRIDIYKSIFSDEAYETITGIDCDEVIEILNNNLIDLLIINLEMSLSRELDLVRKIRNDSTKDVFPINTDSIVINNPDYLPCTMHIIKQNVVDSNLLYKYEKDYRTAVFLNEEKNKGKAVMKIESNLGYNMKDSSVVSNQVTYIYNNTFANQSNIKDIISIRKLNEQDASDRLFDVKIDIYPEGTDISNVSTDNLIVSITGGMTD